MEGQSEDLNKAEHDVMSENQKRSEDMTATLHAIATGNSNRMIKNSRAACTAKQKAEEAQDRVKYEQDKLDHPPYNSLEDSGAKSMHQQELVDEVGVEPFAASLLRRMHEDHCILMKDYHGALPHLEPDGATKKHVTKHLENMGSFLDNTESHFGKHFKDLPPLEGSMDQEEEETDPEEEEDTDEADSDEEELPPAEEAAEGMDMEMRGKLLPKQLNKAQPKIRTDVHEHPVHGHRIYSTTYTDPEGEVAEFPPVDFRPAHEQRVREMQEDLSNEFGEDFEVDDQAKGKGIRDREVSHATRKKIGRGVKQTLLRHGKALPQGEEYHKGIPEEEQNADEDLENVEEDMEQEDEDREEEDDLHDHELDKIDEASNYLDELGNKTDFEDKDRMESYHYHKSLEPMGSVEGYETKALEAGVGRFRKNIGNASSFFKMLSCEKAYGDPHREEAKVHATTLKNGLGELYEKAEDQEEEETPDDKEREMIEEEDEEEGDVVAMPGEMGEKNQPSDNVSPSKTRKILHDGEVNGHPITQKQRGMFGAAAGRGEKALDLTSIVIDRQNVIEDMMANLNKLQEMVCN